MAAALAPSTTLRTVSSKVQETREAAGLRPKAEGRDKVRRAGALSRLAEEAREAEALQATEATEAAIAGNRAEMARKLQHRRSGPARGNKILALLRRWGRAWGARGLGRERGDQRIRGADWAGHGG